VSRLSCFFPLHLEIPIVLLSSAQEVVAQKGTSNTSLPSLMRYVGLPQTSSGRNSYRPSFSMLCGFAAIISFVLSTAVYGYQWRPARPWGKPGTSTPKLGAVSSGDAQCSQIGIQMLLRGGTAVDAVSVLRNLLVILTYSRSLTRLLQQSFAWVSSVSQDTLNNYPSRC
jgi:hypothetical protein